MNILLLMSGSIACAKASALISAWAKQGHEVKVACTPSVSNFIGHATLEGFSGHPVLGDAYAPGQVMDHIFLARWADIIVAAPATSNLINKFAAGIADDAVTALWQAAYGQNKPMFIVPAMNTRMWEYPATRASVQTLRDWGIQVLSTASGDLACGEHGEGRMLEPEAIMAHIATCLSPRASRPRRVLVTAGGTRERIDNVRYIGNHSSGHTAATIANALVARGHDVTWVGAANALRPGPGCEVRTFTDYQDLADELRAQLSGRFFDLVIHAAAVSDFSVERIEKTGKPISNGSKIPSGDALTLHLRPNAKLLDQLQGWSAHEGLRIIAFKLTDGADDAGRKRAIDGLLKQPGVGAVVHNDLGEMRDNRHSYTFHVSPAHGQAPGQAPDQSVACADSAELSGRIIEWLEEESLEKEPMEKLPQETGP